MSGSYAAVVSGGLDSTTMAYALRDDLAVVVSYDYGQRHRAELGYAAATAADLGVDHVLVNLAAILGQPGNALTDPSVAVPDGHYAEETMRSTVVPGRNLLMIAAAVPIAVRYGASAIAIGVHGGDHHIYPDCRPGFVGSAAAAILVGYDVDVVAPFLRVDKAAIVRLADSIGVPVDRTWSCYKDGDRHCGTCGTCVERREAFALAGVVDPTDYATTPERTDL